MQNKTNLSLNELSKKYRLELFKKFCLVKQGHPGSTFSMLDLVVNLFYDGKLKFDDKNKEFADKILISKGHATVALYPILVDFGVIDKKEWDNWGVSKTVLRVFGNISIPGIDVTSGSLGHGIGNGVGMALSYKKRKINKNVYVVISEGELYEGSTWEALLYASHHKLDNLFIIIDVNSLIILGDTKNCMNLDPIHSKIQSYDINVQECDGHNHESISSAFNKFEKNNKVNCLIANTIKGKGLKLMENQAHWHYWNNIDNETISNSIKELENA